MRCHPIIGVRTGPLEFAISFPGPTRDEVQHVVTTVLAHRPPFLPDGFKIDVTLIALEPGAPVLALLERA
jgi:hypothetical protein